jgi:hypothetical protein
MDPTATAAMNNVMREYKEKQKAKFRKKYEMTHRKKVYVVSPYAGDVDANIESAKRYCLPLSSEKDICRLQVTCFTRGSSRTPTRRSVNLGLMFGLSLLALSDEVWVFTAQWCIGRDEAGNP